MSKFKVGQRWKTRDGNYTVDITEIKVNADLMPWFYPVVGIIKFGKEDTSPLEVCFDSEGLYSPPNENGWDLVELLSDPVETQKMPVVVGANGFSSISLHEPINETQDTISEWAEATFGPSGTNAACAARANKEMSELLMCLTLNDHFSLTGEEVADVVICLSRLAGRMGFNIQDEVNKKMAINRARKWDVENGFGQHVKSSRTEVEIPNDLPF